MIQQPSQIAEQYVRDTYPCIGDWISFVKIIRTNFNEYDPTSCGQIALICNSAMKTFDYILNNESNASAIRVSRMLNDLYTTAWISWTVFNSQVDRSNGSKTIQFSSTILQNLATFQAWDNVLNRSPSFDPSLLLDAILGEVTA